MMKRWSYRFWRERWRIETEWTLRLGDHLRSYMRALEDAHTKREAAERSLEHMQELYAAQAEQLLKLEDAARPKPPDLQGI